MPAPRGRRRSRPRTLVLVALVALIAGTTALAGCTSGQGPSSASGSSDLAGSSGGASGAKPAAVAATVDVAPLDGTAKVRLDKVVQVKVSQGRIADVSVTAATGKTLAGQVSPDQLTWTSNGRLAPGTTYQVAVQAASADGKTSSSSSSFSTLTPKGTVSAYIQPGNGWTVGVGMPVVVNFSKRVAVKNRPGVEQALTVSTASNIPGSWRWFSSEQVQWRPKTYWPANTKVNVAANLAGVEISPGVWGASTKRTSNFTVGSAMVSTVDVSRHTLTVTRNGTVIRVIPVTTGKADMATRNGVKVIMSRETTHRMDSTSIGIKKGSAGYYNILTKYAMRLTYSGEFLHAAPWSMGSQGRANVSHGCTGMSTTAAKWLFSNSKVGDVVVYKHSTRSLEWGNGYTAWNMSYSRWQSA